MKNPQEAARDFVVADLVDAVGLIASAEKLLPSAGVEESPKLTAELEAARSALETARATFLGLIRQSEGGA